ncbi:AAA family ATPase [Nocardioides albidus]|uniref:AAA family ATPase n=1 Tax=Nocardioides albidus TaxID=1517589 RepID=A0A5C4VVV3_9ACTN|nr:AAA family ATPase [Nocardioides albidus]
MTHATTRAFDLHDHPAKADPGLIAADEAHFGAIETSLERTVAELEDRLADVRRQPGGTGQEAMDRDLEVHRLGSRLRALRRYRLDLCLGRMVTADGETVYVGRFGLTDVDGRRLLVDWRSPAAEPFFGATHAQPMGLVSRRRYRWTGGRVTDYWDEVFSADALAAGGAALDDQSAFVASLGSSRSEQMRDVLATIQADQDAIIRAGSRGTLVVDGGPGTGKTVVALHRAAYLLYADPRLGDGRGGVLFVGPHQPYLAYVADVLPSLGEEGVLTCTMRDLVVEGSTAVEETDPEVARLKSDAAMVTAVEPAVRLYEEPPTEGMVVETDWAEVWLGPGDWAEAFGAPDPGTPHNEARDQVWDALLDILVDKHDDVDASPEQIRRSLRRNDELVDAVTRAWPMIEATDLVGDLWEVPAYLRHCARWLSPDEVRALRRTGPQVWTTADLPLLDVARARLGDPEAARARRRREASAAAEREEMDRVVDHLIATDDSDMMIMSMLRGADLRGALAADGGRPEALPGDPGRFAGPFAHVVVDEAQELTDAEWQMLLRRCPSRSLTVVGDRAQARHGFTESWSERLERVGLRDVGLATLTINYRTPVEVMAAAAPVIRAVLPDANVPTSVRSTGEPVRYADRSELVAIVEEWLAEHDEGVACVIGDPSFPASPRVRSLAPEHAKGLEFDLVVLVEPERLGIGIEGAVDRYVAMTRATQRLVVVA